MGNILSVHKMNRHPEGQHTINLHTLVDKTCLEKLKRHFQESIALRAIDSAEDTGGV